MNFKKLFSSLICTTLFICSTAYAFDDSVLLQNKPIFVGEESFLERIKPIQNEREPLGLVLSGGSARAYSHIGVLRVLERENIKPDFIVANSMGSIIGLLYASGFSVDDIEYVITNVDLNSFFDIVGPIHGGLLSSRYFVETLSRLFPNRHFDIKDSIIPILIPAEDLVSKRTVVFAEGNISEIMTASFAMSFMMEPVHYTLPDGTKTQLVDAGTVDLGTIYLAERYSKNLLISTALYTPNLTFNNPITILNRTFSIGKERILINNLQNNDYKWIRNDVETFSFMDFANVEELIRRGELSTEKFLTENEKPFASGTFDSETDGSIISQTREIRHKAALSFVKGIKQERAPFSPYPYFGIKIRPTIPVIDTPDFFLNQDICAGAYIFFDYKPFMVRTGIRTNIKDSWGGDIFVRLRPDNLFVPVFTVFSSVNLSFQNISNIRTIAACEADKSFYINDALSLHPYSTVETEFITSGSTLDDFRLLFRTGLEFKNPNGKSVNYSFNPYFYIYSPDTTLSFSKSVGVGGNTNLTATAIPYIGFNISETARYHRDTAGIEIFKNDCFRGGTSNETIFQTNSNFLSLTKGEIFWYTKNTNVTWMESIKLEKAKIGIFADCLVYKDNMEITPGVFTKLQVSLSGLSNINFEGYISYDISNKKPIFGITFIQGW